MIFGVWSQKFILSRNYLYGSNMTIMIVLVYMIAPKWLEYHKHGKQTAKSTQNFSYENQPQNERYAWSQKWWWQ